MMADSRVENGPDSRQHIWDCEGKGSQMVLGAEVSLWSKAITWSPEVNTSLMKGADRLAVGVIRKDKLQQETNYDVDVKSLVLSSEIQWPVRAGFSNSDLRNQSPDLHFKWASDALYAFVLNTECDTSDFPNSSKPLAHKFCVEVLVDQDACNLKHTNQTWLTPIMKELNVNPQEQGIDSIELGVKVAKELQHELASLNNMMIDEKIRTLQAKYSGRAVSRRRLKVSLIDASHLLPLDGDGTSDPYAVIALRNTTATGVRTQNAKSKVIKNDCNPCWAEEYTFDTPGLANAAQRHSLHIVVHDQDAGGMTSEICGEITVHFFHPDQTVTETYVDENGVEQTEVRTTQNWEPQEGTDLTSEQLRLLMMGHGVEQEFILKDSAGQDIYHTNGIQGAGEASVIRLRFQWMPEIEQETGSSGRGIFGNLFGSKTEHVPKSEQERREIQALERMKRKHWEVPVVVRLLGSHLRSAGHGVNQVRDKREVAQVSTTTYTLTDQCGITAEDMYLFIAAQEHHEILVTGEPQALIELTQKRSNVCFPLFTQIHGGLDVILVRCNELTGRDDGDQTYVQFTVHRGGIDGDRGGGAGVAHHRSTLKRGADPEWGSTLNVAVYNCNDLANADADIGTKSDPFVVCTLVDDKRQPMATDKTGTKQNTLDPVWVGEEGHLRLGTTGGWRVGGGRHGTRDISKCFLLVEVFDEDATRNELIGQAFLPLKDYVQYVSGSGKMTVELRDQSMTKVVVGGETGGEASTIQIAVKWDEGGERFRFRPDRLSGLFLTVAAKDRRAGDEYIGKVHEPLDELFMASALHHDKDQYGFITLRPRLESSSGVTGYCEIKVRWRPGVEALDYGNTGSVVTVPWRHSQLSVQSEVWSGLPQQEPLQHATSTAADALIEDRPAQAQKPLSDMYSNAMSVGGTMSARSEVAFQHVKEWEGSRGDADNNLYEFWIRADWNFSGALVGLVGENFDSFDGSMATDKDAYCVSWEGVSYRQGKAEYEPTEHTVMYTQEHYKADATTQMRYMDEDIANWDSTFETGDLIVVNVVMAESDIEYGCHATFFKKGQREPLAVIRNLPSRVYPAVTLQDGTGSNATFGVTKYRKPPQDRIFVDHERQQELARRLREFYEYFNPRPARTDQAAQWEAGVAEVCACAGYDERMVNAMLVKTYGTDLRMYRLGGALGGGDDRELIAYTTAYKLTASGFGLRGTYDVEVGAAVGGTAIRHALDSSQLSTTTKVSRGGWRKFVEEERVVVADQGNTEGRVVRTRHPSDRSRSRTTAEYYGQVAKMLLGQAPLIGRLPAAAGGGAVAYPLRALRLQVLRVDGLTQGLSVGSYTLLVKWCNQRCAPQAGASSLPMDSPDHAASGCLKWCDYFLTLPAEDLRRCNHVGAPLLSVELFVREEHLGRAVVCFDGQMANDAVKLPDRAAGGDGAGIFSITNHESAVLRRSDIEHKKRVLEKRAGKADDAGFSLETTASGTDLYFTDLQSDDKRKRLVVAAEDRWKLTDTGLGWVGHPRAGSSFPKSFGLLEMLAAQHNMYTFMLSNGNADRASTATVTFKLTMEVDSRQPN